MKRYLPLILVETYLLVTLSLYFFGPVNFKTHNFVFVCSSFFVSHGLYSGLFGSKEALQATI